MVQTSTQVDLKLEIPPEWDSNLTLSDLWLEAVDVKGKRTTVWIGTPIPELVAGGSLKVTNLPLPADLEAAVLIARVDVDGKNLSLRMPIYVDPEK
jgi:hypothetical protein